MGIAKLDYYEVLNVERTATFDEIGEAFKKLELLFSRIANEGLEIAIVWLAVIREIYRVLSDPELREAYDSGRFDPKISQQNILDSCPQLTPAQLLESFGFLEHLHKPRLSKPVEIYDQEEEEWLFLDDSEDESGELAELSDYLESRIEFVLYLLNTGNFDAKTTEFEARLFEDAEVYASLQEVETDLIDDYIKGNLPEGWRIRFEMVYLTDKRRRQKVDSARMLNAILRSQRSSL